MVSFVKLCLIFLFPLMIHIKQMSLQKGDAWFRSPRRHPWRHTIETSRLVCAGYPAIDTIGSCEKLKTLPRIHLYRYHLVYVHNSQYEHQHFGCDPTSCCIDFLQSPCSAVLFFVQWFLAPYPTQIYQLWQQPAMAAMGNAPLWYLMSYHRSFVESCGFNI